MPTDNPDPSDSELALLERWRTGDSRAGDALAARYDTKLSRFFRHKVPDQEADDLKQQTWLELLKGSSHITCFAAYFFTIARRVLLHHVARTARGGAFDPLTTSLAAADPSLSGELARHQRTRNLLQALRHLPFDTQLLLELRYFEEMSVAEMALIFDVPQGTIKSRLSTARLKLEAMLAEPPAQPVPDAAQRQL